MHHHYFFPLLSLRFLFFVESLPALAHDPHQTESSSATIAETHPGRVAVDHPQCRLFLAESTIPNAGLGIFTAINLREGDPIGEPDLVVPLPDFEWHAGADADSYLMWMDYSWTPRQVGIETDMEDGNAVVIGTGSMPNCNFALINAKESKPDYDHVGLHPSKDVGAGAFTGLYNQKLLALRSVPVGGELFAHYGEHWFLARAADTGLVPLKVHFARVDRFLTKFNAVVEKNHRGDFLEFARDLWDVVVAAPIETMSSNALPMSFDAMLSALKIGSAESRLPFSVRSLDWLHERGRCMDNIRPGNSTVKQAGRGAFASRFIPDGGLVAPGPLLHIPNKTSLYMYGKDPETGNRDPENRLGMQLILNYCFGHKKSTVILCPYTSPSAYINHNSSSPNAKVVWAKDDTPNHNPDWLEEDVDFLKQMEVIGLSIDFIATRDIQPGEEIFIDYGKEWEDAWNNYVDKWTPPEGYEDYKSAMELQKDVSIPLRTLEEQEHEPYPENVRFYCHYQFNPNEEEGTKKWESEYEKFDLYPCAIIHRSNESGEKEYYYSAFMLDEKMIDDTMHKNKVVVPEGEIRIMTDVPREAIEVRDSMYAKVEYLHSTFRHELMFPDDIFPNSWMNLETE